MFSPKRTKYRKYQKGVGGAIKGVCSNNTQLGFGRYGLKAIQAGRLSARTIETVRRTITRKLRRTGQIWIRVFPDLPVTKKPSEMRMGKGKGKLSSWVSRVEAGQILFEIDGAPLQLAKQAADLAYFKLPLKTVFVCVKRLSRHNQSRV